MNRQFIIIVFFTFLSVCIGANTFVDAVTPSMTIGMSLMPGEKFAVNFSAPVGCTDTAWIGIIPSVTIHNNEVESDKNSISRQNIDRKFLGTIIFTAPK